MRLAYCNDGHIRLTGYGREEYLHRTRNDALSPVLAQDLPLIHGAIEKLFQGADETELTFRIRRGDGQVRYITLRGIVVDQREGYFRLNAVTLDVSEQREAQELLRVSQEEIRLAMTQMGKMVCLYDVKTRSLTMPDSYAQKHGLSPVMADCPHSLLQAGIIGDEESRACFTGFFRRIQSGEKTGGGECFLQCADGTWCWERGEFVTIFASDSRPVKAILAIEDTTREHRLGDENEELKRNEQVLRLVAAHSGRIVYRYDLLTHTARATSDEADTMGIPQVDTDVPESIIQKGIVMAESAHDFRRIFQELHAGVPFGSAKIHIISCEGRPTWMDMQYSLISDGTDTPRAAVISFLDVTDVHEKELAYERYQQSVKHYENEPAVLFAESDLTADVMEKRGGRLLPDDFPDVGSSHTGALAYCSGRYLSQVDGEHCRRLFSREHLITLYSDGVRTHSAEYLISLQDEPCWIKVEVQMIQDPYTGHIRMYTILRDVTSAKNEELSVRRQAERDGMTELYNHATTDQLVREKLSAHTDEACILLIADLDNLKLINDTLGHAQGDRAIALVAKTIKGHFRSTDIVGRVGGDEFLAYLEGAGNEKRLRGVMASLMKKLSDLRIGPKEDMTLHGSIGVGLGKVGQISYEELYHRADKALYHVKRNGKNDYAFYTEDMDGEGYQYQGHEEVSLWKAEAYDRAELKRLLYAISALYPLVVAVNLTKNTYYMMEYDAFSTTVCPPMGNYTALIQQGASTFDPVDRDSFLQAFSRESLLSSYENGERTVTHTGRQLGDDGVYRTIQTTVVFTVSDVSGDVMQMSFSREVNG